MTNWASPMRGWAPRTVYEGQQQALPPHLVVLIDGLHRQCRAGGVASARVGQDAAAAEKGGEPGKPPSGSQLAAPPFRCSCDLFAGASRQQERPPAPFAAVMATVPCWQLNGGQRLQCQMLPARSTSLAETIAATGPHLDCARRGHCSSVV